MKLERLIRQTLGCGRREARARLGAGRVQVNGSPEFDAARLLGPFDRVECEGAALRFRIPRYVALHKPAGHVSATTDPDHPTVIDLIDTPWASELHLAGRLDRLTTGLVILTNDSRFSEGLTSPGRKVPKVYVVDTNQSIPEAATVAFEAGMRFEKEDVTTAPAVVERLADLRCRLTIFEGKHHQVKRMFARFGIKVVGLHRESVGAISLDGLLPGEWRELAPEGIPQESTGSDFPFAAAPLMRQDARHDRP